MKPTLPMFRYDLNTRLRLGMQLDYADEAFSGKGLETYESPYFSPPEVIMPPWFLVINSRQILLDFAATHLRYWEMID